MASQKWMTRGTVDARVQLIKQRFSITDSEQSSHLLHRIATLAGRGNEEFDRALCVVYGPVLAPEEQWSSETNW